MLDDDAADPLLAAAVFVTSSSGASPACPSPAASASLAGSSGTLGVATATRPEETRTVGGKAAPTPRVGGPDSQACAISSATDKFSPRGKKSVAMPVPQEALRDTAPLSSAPSPPPNRSKAGARGAVTMIPSTLVSGCPDAILADSRTG